ncbi:sulfate permease [Altererythrobacter sp. SALINAS58]|uniref:SulP family inorganic anion transporter n=1 Tax=Alteripontixanthobacter muriae TaxID=2705546 RepID=UPI0015763D1E|nr:sulfate permease [Alteripontixanthobacter muriae]NTZ42675.1 sulfate permease [Alteripontixanthobacter muriae]
MNKLANYLPILAWGKSYNRDALTSDLLAAVIVSIMLIPQSLAYALLAGLPAEVGLYASIAPLLMYAVFGTSRTLSVGPVAVVSLMTATAAGGVAIQGSPEYIAAALILALISGLILTAMGLLRLGFLANLLSHPVISGFITASAILIAVSQAKHILGISASGETLPELLPALARNLEQVHLATLLIGLPTMLFLFWARKGLGRALLTAGIPQRSSDLIAKAAPAISVLATVLAVGAFGLNREGVAVVGAIPQGLPPLTVPLFDPALWSALLVPALLISIIGFVESISVAQTLAAKRRQRIEPDQELIGLGTANLGAAFTGGYPVTGGFSRSVVNFDAGAETPAAGAYTALAIALAALFLTPLLFFLPLAVLAATIIVAVLGLVNLRIINEVWHHSKSDFAAITGTIGLTLLFGVEPGVIAGVLISLALYLWRASRPHAAIVGLVPGTQHFRNILRHDVETRPDLLTLRIDESLTFINTRWLEEYVLKLVADRPELKHLVLMFSAVNAVDASALESLEVINSRLKDAGVRLHLSEVKGPVLDRLKRSHLLEELSGRVYLSQFEAFASLRPE